MSPADVFQALWNKYPRRLGRKKAFLHFKASVKTGQDRLDIQKALWNYIQRIKKERTEERFIQHGSTWFNNWRDWVDYKPPDDPPIPQPTQRHEEREITESERLEALNMLQKIKETIRRVPA